MAPFARRRAPIYVSAALWGNLTLVQMTFVLKTAVPVTPAFFFRGPVTP